MDITTNTEHREGPLATMIEEQTAKIPSDIFLWSALGAMSVSLGLKIAGKKHEALFVGQWAAPFLLLGLYNKLVKLEGHDAKDKSIKDNQGQALSFSIEWTSIPMIKTSWSAQHAKICYAVEGLITKANLTVLENAEGWVSRDAAIKNKINWEADLKHSQNPDSVKEAVRVAHKEIAQDVI